MYITDMDLINAKISAMGTLNESDIIKYILNEDINSKAKTAMYEGDRYYNAEHDSLNKNYNEAEISETEEIDGYEKEQLKSFKNPNRSNHHNVHAFHKLLVDQKVSYMVGREPTISVLGAEADDELKDFENMISAAADEGFDETIQDLVRGASNKGFETIHFYYDDDGNLKYCIVPATELILVYDSQYQKHLEQVIRYYSIKVVKNGITYMRRKVEWWTENDVTYYVEREKDIYVRDPDYPVNPISHWQDIHLDENRMEKSRTPNAWGRVPFVVLENNCNKTTDLQPIKGLIDAYDYISSEGTNNFLDLVDLYWIIQGYGGETAAAVVRKLKINKAVSISGGEGDGVKAQQVNLPVQERIEFLKMLRQDIYHLGMGIDIDDDRFGNTPSGVALKFRYANLRHKCENMSAKLKRAIKEFFYFITDDYNRKHGTSYDPSLIKVTLNYSQIANDVEMVDIITKSAGIVSKKTLLENHPLVTDVNEELKELEAEKISEENALSPYSGGTGDAP